MEFKRNDIVISPNGREFIVIKDNFNNNIYSIIYSAPVKDMNGEIIYILTAYYDIEASFGRIIENYNHVVQDNINILVLDEKLELVIASEANTKLSKEFNTRFEANKANGYYISDNN